MISVKEDVDALSDPGDAHDDKQFWEEDRLALQLLDSLRNAAAAAAASFNSFLAVGRSLDSLKQWNISCIVLI